MDLEGLCVLDTRTLPSHPAQMAGLSSSRVARVSQEALLSWRDRFRNVSWFCDFGSHLPRRQGSPASGTSGRHGALSQALPLNMGSYW